MKKNWIIVAVIGLVVVALATVALFLVRGDEDNWICVNNDWVQHGHPSSPKPPHNESCPGKAVCTMEAKVCPDGSAVGRTGENCDFADCPNSSSTASLANPASVNCGKQGGKTVIQKRPDGGEYGLCYFDDNRACEEWAMMRGDCAVGGVKTTGYDTDAQKFCAWSGGSTLAVADAVCTFKDGSQCSAEAFYNGTCQKGEKKVN
jgi:putative hemolysin